MIVDFLNEFLKENHAHFRAIEKYIFFFEKTYRQIFDIFQRTYRQIFEDFFSIIFQGPNGLRYF